MTVGNSILVLNCGSPSVKYALFSTAGGLTRLQSGALERVGTPKTRFRTRRGDANFRPMKEIQMQRRLTTALMALPALLTSLPAQAQTAADRPSYWHYGWDWGWGHMIFGSLMMILFWGGIILVIVLAVRWLGGGPSQGAGSPPPRKRALDILQERFARGEIDKEEFEERRRLLSD